MRSKAELARLRRLKKFYSIAGDGVARLRLDDAAGNKTFKRNIRKLANLELEVTPKSEENSREAASQT